MSEGLVLFSKKEIYFQQHQYSDILKHKRWLFGQSFGGPIR